MIAPIPPTGCRYKVLTADGQVKDGPGILVGILCTTSSSLVLDVYDNTALSGTKIVDDLPMDAKEFQEIPAQCDTGIYVDFASGTGTITVFFI